MNPFWPSILYSFLIAFGIVLGASIFAGLSAFIVDHPPLKTMLDVAGSIKIWAVAAALGGTFSSLEILEKGLFKGEIKSIVKQVIYIAASLWGANMAYMLIRFFKRCGEIWFGS